MKPKRKLLTPILIGLLLIIVVLMVVASQQSGPTFTPPVLPQNNGYDQLLEAAKLLAPRTDFYDEMESGELAKIVEQNKPALKLVEAALDKTIFVPVDWTAAPGSAGSLRLNDMSAQRTLARALAAQARFQRSRGNFTAATDSSGQLCQLGTACGHGGLLNNYLVGLAVEGLGLDELRRVDISDPEIIKAAFTAAISYREHAESAYQVIEREKEYVRASSSGFQGWLMRRNLDSMFDPATRSGLAAESRLAAQQGLLLLHLALHQFHLGSGEWPATLEDLPAINLSPQPLDPFSNQPFIYSLTDEGYELYSVGENKLDDGGQTDENGMAPDFVFDLLPTSP